MSRNRHHRLRDHFGYDLDTAMVLDGNVGDIPDGTILHDALSLIASGGGESELDPINWASPDLGTSVLYRTTIESGSLVQFNVTTPGSSSPVSQDISFDDPVTAGNLLVILIATRSYSGAMTGPGDWSAEVPINTNGFNSGDGAMFYKVADGTEGTGPFTFGTGAATQRRMTLAEFAGPATFVDSASTTGGATSSYNIGDVTPTASSATTLIAGALNSGGITGITDFTTVSNGLVEGGINGPRSILAYRSIYPASGDYSAVVTQSSVDVRGGAHLAFSETGNPWLDGPSIQDADNTTYHTATGADCMRVALEDPLLVYEAIVRMAFSTTSERSYSFYGTNEADYSGLELLDEQTFAPIGSNTAENITFAWTAANTYQYFVLEGPDESRRLHELTLRATIGAITTSHPLLTNRDLTSQHPADSVSFNDAIAGLGETDVQGAIEKLAAHTSSGSGISAVIANTSTGVKFDWEMPFAGSISEVRLLADTTGSMVVDLWKDTYANFPPTVADSICASAKPTLASAAKYQDTTLTGWTTSFNVGDIIRVNVDSVTTITRATLSLRLERSASSPAVGSIQLGLIDRTATIREPTLNGPWTLELGRITQTAQMHSPTVT